MIKSQDMIGNTFLKKETNANGTKWKPVLRQRWLGKFRGLKEYSRANMTNNYLIIKVGGYVDENGFNPDPFILVGGKRVYLNYTNSISSPFRITLVDIHALECSKQYELNDKYSKIDAERNNYHIVNFKAFDEMRKLAQKQFEVNNELPTYDMDMAWERLDNEEMYYGIRHYIIISNIGLSEEYDEYLMAA